MPAISAAIAAIGIATSVAATAEQMSASKKASSAQNSAAGAEEQIAATNQQQLQLDAARQRRNIARQAVIARSTALSNATGQGAGFGASSGVQGGMAQATSQQNFGLLTSAQNLTLGNSIFSLNQQVYQDNSRAATYQGQGQMWGGISQFGNMALQNANTLGKVGSYAFNSMGWGS